MAQFLFVTDLDNTLVGDDAAMQRLNDRLQQHRQAHNSRIVYATGRSLTLYRELQAEKSLLHPDALIANVGTTIFYGDDPEPDPHWAEFLGQGWDRDRIVAIAGHFADLVPQPNTEQGLYKVSYYLWEVAAAEVLPRLQSALEDAGFYTTLIYSGGKDLDILPQQANKGAAINFLREQWQVDGDRTVVCGDSGNDVAMFEQVAGYGVIVGNARPELLLWHTENPSEKRYLAQSFCAGGILEGLEYFGFLSAQ